MPDRQFCCFRAGPVKEQPRPVNSGEASPPHFRQQSAHRLDFNTCENALSNFFNWYATSSGKHRDVESAARLYSKAILRPSVRRELCLSPQSEGLKLVRDYYLVAEMRTNAKWSSKRSQVFRILANASSEKMFVTKGGWIDVATTFSGIGAPGQQSGIMVRHNTNRQNDLRLVGDADFSPR